MILFLKKNIQQTVTILTQLMDMIYHYKDDKKDQIIKYISSTNEKKVTQQKLANNRRVDGFLYTYQLRHKVALTWGDDDSFSTSDSLKINYELLRKNSEKEGREDKCKDQSW